MKRHMVIGLFLGLSLSLFAQADKEQAKYDYRVLLTNNWVFYSPETPTIQVVASNKASRASVATTLQLEVTTDQYQPVTALSQTVKLSNGDSIQIDFSFILPAPGFYRCRLTEKGDNGLVEVKKFNIGYEPESIVSLPDHQPDLRAFWGKARAELDAVQPEYQLTLIPDTFDNKLRKLYLVKMKSLEGVEISGYYSVPVKKGKHPVIISYMGYGSKPWIPGGTPGYAEFVLSVRGQALNEPTNIYGDWITYRLDSKDHYYYRGAFMDLVRAVDFVASRPEINTNQIFAEGGSQGGAFSLAACALDSRIRAAAPTIPFLSDYRDYFKIVGWPASSVLNKQKELGLSDEKMYEVLSYFDIKNLAGWIQCPILMGVGLQDEVCPPHTNFAGYNRIRSSKNYYIYPLNGHNTPASWWQSKMDFFKKFQ